MTDNSLARLKLAFDAEPTFEFLSPEGHGGYPRELLVLAKAELERLIAVRRDYERAAAELGDDDSSPIPEDEAADETSAAARPRP